MAFQPKQLTPYEAHHLAELQGNGSQQAIEFSLNLLPPFQAGDVIHDNACGAGAVTSMIMGRNPPDIHIDATDINSQFVEAVAALAKENQWPVRTATMSAQEISFADDRFTHSITSFAFHCIGDDRLAAKQVYRTLRPGGTAVASIWTSLPVVDLIHHAHWRTRGREGPLPTLVPLDLFTEADLRESLQEGGFQADKITCYRKECTVEVADVDRWARLAWGYLAPLPTGWTRQDEERWDEAIEDIVEQVKSTKGISTNEKGETVLKMVACIAVAKK